MKKQGKFGAALEEIKHALDIYKEDQGFNNLQAEINKMLAANK